MTAIAPAPPEPALLKEQSIAPSSPRYHALDCVRAAAMLLGVFYHWQFVGGGGFGMAGGPKGSIDHWLHSFRMALFFLISGFFGNMMLGKYGVGKYLLKRWWRIGAPLLVAILAFATLRFMQDYYPWAAAPGPGGTQMFGGAGGFGAMPGAGGGAPAFGGASGGYGFGGPTGYGGAGGQQGAFPGYGGNPGGGFGGGFGMPPGNAAATPNMPAPPAMMDQGPAHPWIDALLKKFNHDFTRTDGRKVRIVASYFELQHLWFLWYLLVFVTLAPLVVLPLGWLLKRGQSILDRMGGFLVRFDLLPLVLAGVTLPALLHAKGMDWTLTNPAGFSGVFPDFLVQYFPDLPFYFIYFLVGWWFFRQRQHIKAVGRPWIFNLLLGITAFAVSQKLHDNYGPAPAFPAMGGFGFNFGTPQAAPTTAPAHPAWIRLAAFGCYSLGAAYSGFGLMGLFQRFFDRATVLGKYFTDTMLWVYLVQLALIPYLASWVDYSNTSWWEATLGGVTLVTAAALVLFEVFIRPTPLVHIFGPASLSKRRSPAPGAAAG